MFDTDPDFDLDAGFCDFTDRIGSMSWVTVTTQHTPRLFEVGDQSLILTHPIQVKHNRILTVALGFRQSSPRGNATDKIRHIGGTVRAS